jgi:hypothetical protein
MLASGLRFIIRAAAGALVAAVLFSALSINQAQAATVDEFLANPTAVMAQYPNGGADFISLVRDVATSHPEALATITGLISSASADQQGAIGSGLGQAYTAMLTSNPTYAASIQSAIGASSSSDAQTAYSGATGNVSTASTSGPGAGGAGGGGGGGSGGPAGGSGFGGTPSGGSNSGSGGTTNGSGSSQTTSGTFTGGGGSVTGTTTSSGTTTSVSPHG